MMKSNSKHSSIWFLGFAFHLFFSPITNAQSCGFSFGKSLHELQLSIQEQAIVPFSTTSSEGRKTLFPEAFQPLSDSPRPERGIFLPRWSAENLPFFCKIEHDWAKNEARIPLKFRLGSVDYVDWLEGKSFDKSRY